MDKRFSKWEDKQCSTCQFGESAKQGMSCGVFELPYYVWGKYTRSHNKWEKRKTEKPSPKECWAYCGTREEYKARMDAIKVYGCRLNAVGICG
jgi:hypothetical protein